MTLIDVDLPDDRPLEFGDPVRVTHTLHRTTNYHYGSSDPVTKQWEREEHLLYGWVTGLRTYSNGSLYLPYEEPGVYTVRKAFPVVLVTYNIHRNAVACLPSDVERIHRKVHHD